MKKKLILGLLLSVLFVWTVQAGVGQIRREIWDNTPTTTLDDALAVINSGTPPTLVDTLTEYQFPGRADNYISRVKGWLIPKQTGQYTFWIASDDDSGLWLSQDAEAAHATEICSVTGWTGWQEWGKFSSQKSDSVSLQANTPYAIYTIHRESDGGDSLNVAWAGPGIGSDPVIIAGEYLLDTDPYKPDMPNPASGSTEVKTGQLSWLAPVFLSSPTYNVYISTDPNDPNANVLATGLTEPTVDAGAIGSDLAFNTQYFWRVDAIQDGTVHPGPVWSFTTAGPAPYFTVQPQGVTLLQGKNTSFTAQADAVVDKSIIYQWYKVVEGDDDIPVSEAGSEVTTLSFSAVTLADEGQYYCVATNSGGSTLSNIVMLNIQVGLAHRYDFTSDPNDTVGNADGILINNTGKATFADGKLILGNDGTQWSADATGDYVDLPNGIISQLGTQATIEAWVTWNGPADSWWQRIYDFGVGNNGEDVSASPADRGTYMFMTPLGGQTTLWVGWRRGTDANEHSMGGPNPLPVGEEVYVAFVWDETKGETRLYYNGQRVATGIIHFKLADMPDVNNWLGRSQWNDIYFNGSYDELRIYDVAISDAGIAGSYAAGPDADVSNICLGSQDADFNKDCQVDLQDMAIFASQWLWCGFITCQ